METEVEGKAFLAMRGFTDVTLSVNPNAAIKGMCWECRIEAWAPVFGGRAKGWGATVKEAVLNALGCHPVTALQEYAGAILRGEDQHHALKKYRKSLE